MTGLNDRRRNLRRVVFSGVVAALYVILTLPFAQFAFGPVQFRMAEILAVLPIFGMQWIPGVAIGCFLANLFNPGALGPIDIIFGTLATVIAGFGSAFIGKKKDILGIIPPILSNGLIVGFYLPFLLIENGSSVKFSAILVSIGEVTLSEAAVMVILGIPFLFLLNKFKIKDKI